MVMVAERQLAKLKGCSLPFLQLPKMTSTDNSTRKKLIVKISSKGVRVDSEKESYKYGAHDEHTHSIVGDENKKFNMKLSEKLLVQGSKRKHERDEIQGGPKEKRRKMDRSIRHQCCGILKELMDHKHGWPFNKPVDPVAYNIPDYFQVITKPMDLGTIRSNIENNVYLCPEEFAADVRLTFSNCMLYNPPHNTYHWMAKELNIIFNRRWELLEAKGKHESKKVCVSNGNGEGAQGKLQMCPPHVISVNRRAMSLEEKQKLSKELKEMLRGNMTEKMQSVFKKYNLSSLKQMMDVDINSIDDELLWELKRMVKSSLNLTAAKQQSAKMPKRGEIPLSRKVIGKGTDKGSRVSVGSSIAKPAISSVESKCGSCGNLTCRCSLQSSKSQAFSSGAGSVVEDNVCVSPSLVCGSTCVSDEGGTPVVDVRLSPKQSLRAAMLKSRFADTIFKAKQKTLLDQCPIEKQLEKEKLEKQQREEKARKAQIAAKREASRIAFEQMEKTVEIDDKLKYLKELERLCQFSVRDYPLIQGGYVGNVLERLGLYRKDDLFEDDDEEGILKGDGEEGEIS